VARVAIEGRKKSHGLKRLNAPWKKLGTETQSGINEKERCQESKRERNPKRERAFINLEGRNRLAPEREEKN